MNNLAIRYTDERNTDKGFLKVENLIITKSLEELTYITFTTTSDVAVQGTIVWDGQPYEVTEVSKGDNNTLEVYAVQDVRDLKSALRRSVFYTGMTAAAVIRKILEGGNTADSSDTVGTDWTFVTADNITRKRDIDLDYTTVWDALMEVRDIWHIELEIDSEHKKITLYGDRSRGKKTEEQTSHFHLFEGVNISELELEYEGDEFYNIIQGYGQKTTKKTDKEWIEYKSTKAIKKTDTIPAHTTYYSSKTEQDAAHAVARKWVDKDPHASDPDAKTTMFQLKVNGEWGTKYYASTHNYDTNGNLVDADEDQNRIVKSVTTTFTEKSSKIYKTTQTTKLLRAKDATDEQKQEVLNKYGFSMSGSTIYCYDYSNIKNRAYLQSDKYDDLDALLEDMCLYLRESYQPKVNLSVSMAQLPGDYRKDIGIGDSVVIKTKDDKKFVMRVLSMTYDIEKPDNVKLVLGTRKKSLADSQRMQKRFNAKNTSNGSLTSAATNNVKGYTNADGGTEYAITGAFVTMDELDDVLDLANSRMTIQNIDAGMITTGELDANKINVANLTAEDVQLSTLNGHTVNEGTLLARFLDDLVVQTAGVDGDHAGNVIWCNSEDMQTHMETGSEEYIAFENGDIWFESGVISTRSDTTSVWKWDFSAYYSHPELGNTHWMPRKWDTEDFAAKCITAEKIASGSITGDAIAAGCVVAKNFYLGQSESNWALRYLANSNKVELGGNTTITWNNVTSKPDLPDKAYVDARVYSGPNWSYQYDTEIGYNWLTTSVIKANNIHLTGSARIDLTGASASDGVIKVAYGSYYNYIRPATSYVTDGSNGVLISGGGQININDGNIIIGTSNIKMSGHVQDQSGSRLYASYSHQHYSDTLYATQVGSSSYKCKVYLAPDGSTTSNANLYASTSGGFIKYKSGSQRKWKHDIVPVENGPAENAPEKLYDVDVVSFKYNDDYLSSDDSRYQKDMPGFIIDDMMETYPIGVDIDEEGEMVDWNAKILLPAMLKLIQDQKKKIDELENRLEALENEANEARN